MKIREIRKVYHNKNGTVEALKGISLDISDNGITAVLGASGCGKTTLLNIIAQADHDFEGEVTEVPELVYLRQEVELMEKLTVLENLLIIVNDRQRCASLLEAFQMLEHQDKQVSKCSSGQKKRVQFMKAMLLEPSLILCDESTAALDHENVEIIMEKLREYAVNHQVLFVTHDSALAERYADRIIKMRQGVIESDEIVQRKDRFHPAEPCIKPKSGKETLRLSFLKMKSEKLFTLSHFIITSVCACLIFVMLNLLATINEQNSIYNTFKNGRNLLVSVPKKSVVKTESQDMNITGPYATAYFEYDFYQYDDILEIIEQYPEIIAVEAFYSESYQIVGNNSFRKKACDIFKPFEIRFEDEEFDEMVHSLNCFNDYPMDMPYLLEQDADRYVIAALSDNDSTANYDYMVRTGLFYNEGAVENIANQISVYTLVNDFDSIPVLYGRIPQNENEILLDKNTAQMWMDLRGIEAMESLLQTEITMHVTSYKNTLTSPAFESVENSYSFPKWYYVPDQFTFTISGIAATENDYTKMVFVAGEFGKDKILSNFVENDEGLLFEYVHFLLQPNSDAEKIAAEINDFLQSQYSVIEPFRGNGLNVNAQVAVYKDPDVYLKVILGITGVFLAVLMIEVQFRSKRIAKEKSVIHAYGYSAKKELLIRHGLYLGLSAAALLITMPLIIAKVNELAVSNSYAEFMSAHPLTMLGCALLTTAFASLIEMIAAAKR